MERSKVESFVGFCVKSRKLQRGTVAVEGTKRAYLVLFCNTGSPNALKEAKKQSNRLACPLILCKGKTLEEIAHKAHCKIAAVIDEGLANAILSNLNDDYENLGRCSINE